MKIAIASSGLGTVSRGIETWALDTAAALNRRGVDVTLFAAAPVPAGDTPLRIIRCLRRGTRLNRLIVRAVPGFTWRWGLKSDYALEQRTFWHTLKPILDRDRFDILHVQDPLLADCCRRAHLAGATTTRVILAHGTEEPPAFLEPFDYLQHLAPWHLQQCHQKPTPATSRPHWTAIPNFVNTEVYRPVASASERASLRRAIGLPDDAFILGTAAAIKRHHKRIDWLIREFARALEAHPGTPLHLVIAGARTPDFNALAELAHECGKGHVTFLPDHPHAQMPDLLRTFDGFALASLFEMMPIALLEAIASGLPVITHDHPVLAWISGPAGIRLDLRRDGALTEGLRALMAPDAATTRRSAARQYALEHFSETVVIQRYIDYYDHMGKSKVESRKSEIPDRKFP
jgi:glycosyltransferase involved in cell wall biosynthesis